jgi:hypothetical protein
VKQFLVLDDCSPKQGFNLSRPPQQDQSEPVIQGVKRKTSDTTKEELLKNESLSHMSGLHY